MKRVITMVLAFAMVLAGIVIPVDRVSAQSTETQNPDGSYTYTNDTEDGRHTVETVYPDGSRIENISFSDGTCRILKYDVSLNWIETIDYYADGTMKYHAYVDGTIISYFQNGNVEEYDYPNGARTRYYESGEIYEQLDADGTLTLYYKNGKILSRSNADGSWENYDENGKLVSHVNTDGIKENYNEEGKLLSRENTDGSIDFYYESGELKQHLNADNSSIGYYENGVVQYRIEADSSYTGYDENGKVSVIIDKNGAYIKSYNTDTTDKDGTYKEWDENGNLIYQKNPDGTIVIDKRIEKITIEESNGKDWQVLVGDAGNIKNVLIVTKGFTSKKKLRCIDDKGKVLNVKWSTANLSIVSVSKTGIVTGKKIGKTTIVVNVPSIGRKVSIPVKVVKNENSMPDNEKPKNGDGWDDKIKPTYAKISYDEKGNLVAKVKIKNFNKNKISYAVRKTAEITFTFDEYVTEYVDDKGIGHGHYKKKIYKTNKKGVLKKFTLKRGQSKTFTVKIPKSKLEGKYYNLREVDTKIEFDFSAGYYNKTGKYFIKGCGGSMSADIYSASIAVS